MKRKILCWVLAVMLALPATAMAADEEETEEAVSQRKATILVLSITGNELTYMEVETEPETEGESESEEMTAPESGMEGEIPEDGGNFGPGGAGGNMPDMENMQDMMEAFQENGGDMSDMQDMMESFRGNGGNMPGGDGSRTEGDGETADTGDGQSDNGGNFGPGGAGGNMPDMENMQDMMEAMQENGGDMSDMQDMIESFRGNGGRMAGGDESGMEDMTEGDGESFGPGGAGGNMPDMENMQDMIEAFQENGGDLSDMEDMIESFRGNAGQADGGEGFGGMAGTNTVYLQVGVVVHADGKEKTFSILEAGDELEVLFETDDDGNEVITEMWLLNTN